MSPTSATSSDWLDEQYNNRARVPDHMDVIERWQKASAFTRQRSSRRLDLRYGEHPMQTLDVFPSARANAPVLVFIHGGYWRSLDKSDHSFVAPAFVDAGAMVVVPNYALCPEVTIDTIALQMTQAVGWVVRQAALYGGNPQHIVVAGHSAGGHLAAMLLSCDWSALGLPNDSVTSAVSISGLYDLEPLVDVGFLRNDLKLTSPLARKVSPATFPPPAQGVLHAFVGEQESEEFLRQNALIQQQWGPEVVPVCETVAGANHFTVLHALADPSSHVHGLGLELLGLR